MNLQIQDLTRQSPQEEKLVKETHLAFAGSDARYRLFECRSHYLIEISFGKECSRSDVGKSFSRAAYLYDLLIEGEVTPCTMSDILEDLSLT